METNDNINNKYYLYFELIDINLIKILFETLDKNVEIVRLILSKKTNQTELEITCSNSTRTYYFRSKFGNELIKNYVCQDEKIEIELLPNDLVNILKSVDSEDNMLLFYVINANDNKNTMVIEFKQDNSNDSNNSDNFDDLDDLDNLDDSDNLKVVKKNKKKIIRKTKNNLKTHKFIPREKKFTFKIGYPIYPEKQTSKIIFDKKISIDPNKFHNICKDLSMLFDYIKINSKNNKNLYFGYDSSRCDGIIKIKYDESNVVLENITNLKNNNVGGIYHVEDIIGFQKLSDISTDYYFKIKNNYFLESTFIINKYGTINITYIPLKEDVIKNSISTMSNTTNVFTCDILTDSDNFDNMSYESKSNLNIDSEYDMNQKKIKNNKKTINDKIMYIEIEKIELFKLLSECIEKLISEPIFSFQMINNNLTMKIICSNNSKNINLDVNIKNIFGRYKKIDNPINLGIGLKYLNDILKSVDKTDIIIFSIDEHDKNNLTIQIKNKNSSDKISLKRIYKIKLLNVEKDEIETSIKQDDYVYIISMNSGEFYKISKDINMIGEEIKITYDDKNLILSTVSNCKYLNIIKKDNDIIKVLNNDNNKDKIKIINEFEIKDIMLFSKLSGFMDNYNLYLKQNGRFIIKTDFIESMGTLNIQYLSKNIIDIRPNDKNMIKYDTDTMDDKLIFFKLKKINFMKNIIDTLDKLVSDVEWIFTSKSNNANENNFHGLEIISTDPSKTLYIKTKLTNELFKSFYCEKKIFKFGMSLEYFNLILKLFDKSDIAMYCYIEKNDLSNLVIIIKNSEKKNKRIFKIPLQIISTINNKQMSLEFEKKIILKCESLFAKCKMILNNSQFVKICCDKDKLFFKCVGEKEGIVSLDCNDDESLEIISLNENKVECAYEIKNILMFSRLSSITEEFSFYMKNNFALTSIYNFGILGSMTVILSPSNEEYINNQNYDYSDDDEIELLNTNSNAFELY